MKQYFLLIAILASLFGYAQQIQNRNWCFGHQTGLQFNGFAAPTNISSSIYTTEGCATLSDNNGNLLLYTDGVTIYRADGSTMPDGDNLFGHNSSTQSATIVPRPGHTSVYIFTINGISGEFKGLHYTEVELSNNGSVVPGFKNVPLNDENNIPITTGYLTEGNMSEKATSSTHCNGTDYWFVTQIADKVYSYQVTADGVSETPTAISQAPYDLQVWDVASFGQMKISPDGTRIAFAYSSIRNNSTGEVSGGVISIGDFDRNTGEVVFDTAVKTSTSPNLTYFGAEFSPDSNLLYFGSNPIVYRCNAKNPANPNPTNITPSVTNGGLVGNKNQFQLAVDGKIYITDQDGTSNGNNQRISVINDPNNTSNPGYYENTVLLTIGTPVLGLPSWVHQQVPLCPSEFNFYFPEQNFMPYTYHAENHITTQDSYTVVTGQDIAMKAGNYILMSPNTSINAGALFSAEIAECVTCSPSAKVSQRTKNTSVTDEINIGLKLYPNPANEYVNLQVSNDIISSVSITSIAGLTVYKAENNSSETTINISGIQKGIYIVTVATKTGNIYTEKLIIQ